MMILLRLFDNCGFCFGFHFGVGFYCSSFFIRFDAYFAPFANIVWCKFFMILMHNFNGYFNKFAIFDMRNQIGLFLQEMISLFIEFFYVMKCNELMIL